MELRTTRGFLIKNGNINDKIIKENERLLVWERRMRLKFSRLEATLARYNQINDSLKSQIDSLSGGGSKS